MRVRVSFTVEVSDDERFKENLEIVTNATTKSEQRQFIKDEASMMLATYLEDNGVGVRIIGEK